MNYRRKEVLELICDYCGRLSQEDVVVNTIPFVGWYDLSQRGNSMHGEDLDVSFCCLDCLTEFVNYREDREDR